MQIIRSLLVLSLSAAGLGARASSNKLAKFSIRHCSGSECMTARSLEAFLNYNGRMISASNVTLEFRNHGRRRIYDCRDFRADLVRDFYVCDNREARRESLSIDDQLKITRY